nr:MAG TPA: RNA polymerase alpha subunit [Microviridae sp.]
MNLLLRMVSVTKLFSFPPRSGGKIFLYIY